MTPEQIAELERLEKEATPAPWYWGGGALVVDINGRLEMVLWPDNVAGGEARAPADLLGSCGLNTEKRKVANARILRDARNALPSLLSSARDLASLRAAVEALAGEWEAQREEFADADEDDCCAAVIGSFVRELRLLLPGGDDASREGGR